MTPAPSFVRSQVALSVDAQIQPALEHRGLATTGSLTVTCERLRTLGSGKEHTMKKGAPRHLRTVEAVLDHQRQAGRVRAQKSPGVTSTGAETTYPTITRSKHP